MKEYMFDVKMFASIRVKANSESEARATLNDCVDAADANLGAWPDGSPILCEISTEGEAELIEVDGVES